MMTSADEKIESGVEGVDLFDDYMPTYNELHDSFNSQAWMCGRKTMEMFAEAVGTPLEKPVSEIPSGNFIAKTDAKQYAVAVDTKGLLRWSSDKIGDSVGFADHLIIIVTTQTPKEYLNHLRTKRISYIISQSEKVNFEEILKVLKEEFGIKKILLEGGGILNGSMVNVIDEISVLKTPIQANNPKAHSFFGVNAEETNKLWGDFTVVEEKTLENGLPWLRYKHK
jgi:2,5-diamino-6-(ribosylamino)-4(3H)-pyrimidinone 5'-phosphate reductase